MKAQFIHNHAHP